MYIKWPTASFEILGFTTPFTIAVHTDATEGGATPPELNNRGFCLDYVQQPCGAPTG